MKTRIVQTNMTKGEVAPTLHGNTGTDVYAGGVQEATNMLIMPHGGLRRRAGMQKITDNHIGTGYARTESFVFSRDEAYLIIFQNNSIKIYFNGVLQSTEVSTYTEAQIPDIDVIQSADVLIITHEDHAPAILTRGASHTIWTLSNIPLVGIPTYNFGAGAEPVWSATRGYPRTCTFHKGRLWFGGSKSKVSSVWGSVANDFYNFAVGTGAANDAIFDTIDTDDYNEINGIISAGSLQVYTQSQEFYNTAQLLTPADSAWASYSTTGAKRIRPLFLNGATLYIDSSGRTLRQTTYNDNEKSYTPINASLISSHLLNSVVSTAMIKGTTADFSDLVFVVNADGTIAVLNSMRNEGIHGWTKWTTDGLFKDVAVVDKEVYFLIERRGSIFVEKLTEGTYSDHNTVVEGTPPVTDNIVFGLDNITFKGENIVFQNPTTGVSVNSITTNIKESLAYTQYWRVVADSSIQASALPTSDGTDLNHFDITREAYHIEVGLNYDVKVKTLPLNAGTQKDGSIINLRKRVNRVIIRLHESLGILVQDSIMNDRKFVVSLDKVPVPFTGIKEIYLLGYGRLVDIEISQDDPLPFTLLSIDAEVEF